MLAENGGQPLAFEQDLTAAAVELNHYIDRILGKPRYPGMSEKGRLAMSILRNATFVRFMQQSGIAQLGDAPKMLMRYGLAATWKAARFADIVDVFTHSETARNALTREIQAAMGVGVKTGTSNLYALHEDINLGGELFGQDRLTRIMSGLNAGLETASRVTATVSLINPITDALQLMAARAASQRFVDIATGRAAVSPKWMNELGLSSQDLEDIRAVAAHMDMDEVGNIRRWNSERQHAVSRDHADAYDRFLGLVRRKLSRPSWSPRPTP